MNTSNASGWTHFFILLVATRASEHGEMIDDDSDAALTLIQLLKDGFISGFIEKFLVFKANRNEFDEFHNKNGFDEFAKMLLKSALLPFTEITSKMAGQEEGL